MPSRYILAAAALIAAVAMTPVFAQETYVLDPNHTIPTYEVTHMGFSQQQGSFSGATGKVMLDRAAKKGSIDVSIATASVTTTVAALIPRLKGENLFNVEKFPAMTFTSTDLIFDGDNVVGANGDFTLLGVTRPVALKVTGFKCGPNPFSKRPMCAAEATTTIKRSDFGMKWGIPMMASDEVRITIPVEAARE